MHMVNWILKLLSHLSHNWTHSFPFLLLSAIRQVQYGFTNNVLQIPNPFKRLDIVQSIESLWFLLSIICLLWIAFVMKRFDWIFFGVVLTWHYNKWSSSLRANDSSHQLKKGPIWMNFQHGLIYDNNDRLYLCHMCRLNESCEWSLPGDWSSNQ